MAPAEFNFDRDVLPVVRKFASIRFAQDGDRETKVCDAISVAWEFTQDAPADATAKTIAYFAVRRVAVGRQFQQSARDITGPNPMRRIKPLRTAFEPRQFWRDWEDPAEIAALLIDFAAWEQSLTQRQQEVLQRVLQGDATWEVAESHGVTPGAISQTRKRLVELWQAFTA